MFHFDGGIFAVLGVLFDGFILPVQQPPFRTLKELIINIIIEVNIILKHYFHVKK
jgi:hypothetical protein